MTPDELLARDCITYDDVHQALGRRFFSWWSLDQLLVLQAHPSWPGIAAEHPSLAAHLRDEIEGARRRTVRR